MSSQPKKAGEQQVANALIVVWVELQHGPKMFHCRRFLPELQERQRQPVARAHVGPRFQKPPEVTVIVLEALRAERELSGLQSARVEVTSLGRGRRFLGQEIVGVRTER